MPARRDRRFGYDPALDGVRGVAILLVVAYNAGVPGLPGGFLGVDLFFVLSGFLITTLLLDEWRETGTVALASFYARRALRLLPAVTVLVAACVVYASLYGSDEHAASTRRAGALVMVYVANWEYATTPFTGLGVFNHLWSLSVEEQFYLLWPPVLCYMLRRGLGRVTIVALVAGLVAAAAAWRASLWWQGAHPMRLYTGTDTRADALLLGCLVGLIREAWPSEPAGGRWSRAATWIGAALLGVGVVGATWSAPFMSLGTFTLAAAAAAALLNGVAARDGGLARRVLELPPLVATGRISYGIYLWHVPVLALVARGRPGQGTWVAVAAGAAAVVATFVVALGSFYFVERPFLRMKRAFSKPLSKDQPGTAGVAPACVR